MVATPNPLQEKSDNENTLQTDLLSNHDKAEMQATSTTLDDNIHPPFATWKNLIIIGLLYFAMSACGSFSAVSTFIYGELNKNIYMLLSTVLQFAKMKLSTDTCFVINMMIMFNAIA
jgi:hypothetical protein